MRMSGFIHVWRKEMAFQRLKRDLAFRRFENGRKGLDGELRGPICTD